MTVNSWILLGAVTFGVEAEIELRAAIAEADRTDPGWRWEQLLAKREKVADDENGTLQLLAIGKAMPKTWWPFKNSVRYGNDMDLTDEDKAALRRRFESALDDLPPQVRLNQQQIDALERELKNAAPALRLARDLARYSKGRYPWPPDAKPWSAIPPIQPARQAATLLQFDAWLHAEAGRVDKALECCRSVLIVAALGCEEGDATSHRVRPVHRQIAQRVIERALAQGSARENALAELQKHLHGEEGVSMLLSYVRADRASTHAIFAHCQAMSFLSKVRSPKGLREMVLGADWNIPDRVARLLNLNSLERHAPDALPALRWLVADYSSALQRSWAASLRKHNVCVAAAKLPLDKMQARFRVLANEFRTHTPAFGVSTGLAARSYFRSQMEICTARVAVAVERFRLAKGAWPKKLEDLVPDYLAEVPIDCYDGKPLRYKRLKDGVVVYSIGPDGKDNDGRVRPDPGEFPGLDFAGLDFGFRLWDVRQRRQPPQPPIEAGE